MSDRPVWQGTVEHWLNEWARWMHEGDSARLGYPSRSIGIGTGGASEEFDDLVRQADLTAVRKVDAAVRSMTLIEQSAIWHVHLSAVFRLRHDPMNVYEACLPRLEAEMRRRGVF